MSDAQYTLLFMVVAIVSTAIALWRKRALGSKALVLVVASSTLTAAFLFLTL